MKMLRSFWAGLFGKSHELFDLSINISSTESRRFNHTPFDSLLTHSQVHVYFSTSVNIQFEEI